MFVVKDPDVFASTIIPQYFDHNKFSSFARQVGFAFLSYSFLSLLSNSNFFIGTS